MLSACSVKEKLETLSSMNIKMLRKEVRMLVIEQANMDQGYDSDDEGKGLLCIPP